MLREGSRSGVFLLLLIVSLGSDLAARPREKVKTEKTDDQIVSSFAIAAKGRNFKSILRSIPRIESNFSWENYASRVSPTRSSFSCSRIPCR
jgi:hypothetical protein